MIWRSRLKEFEKEPGLGSNLLYSGTDGSVRL
jgi:hypothetical protein